MNAQVNWLAPNRLHLICAPGWTWHDFDTAMQAAHEQIAAQPHPVDLIIDLRGSLPDYHPLAHFRWATRGAPPNLARRIVVAPAENLSARIFLEQANQIMRQAYPLHPSLTLVETLADVQLI